jgi:hypothetical protein
MCASVGFAALAGKQRNTLPIHIACDASLAPLALYRLHQQANQSDPPAVNPAGETKSAAAFAPVADQDGNPSASAEPGM